MKKSSLGVVGSRDFTDYELMRAYIDENVKLDEYDKVVSGGAKGADTLAEKFARERGLLPVIFKPDWTRYGKQAGFLRNTDIVDASDALVAFLTHENSNGTLDSIQKARARGIPVHVCCLYASEL
jgi:hypothetical protein